jgi:thymidylate synthase (FAD)
MKVELLKYTMDPELTVALAARLCYSKTDIEDLLKMPKEKTEELITKLMRMGHHSPFEHANFTFGIEGISRVTTHQLVRHRIASYSQQSQRYVNSSEFNYTIPTSISQNTQALKIFNDLIESARKSYDKLLELGIHQEDARYLLPSAIQTRIIVTMNARELFHFFKLRCCNRAQWEIRNLAWEMLRKVKEVAPKLFEETGPSCLKGPCPEGEYSCGRPYKS